MGRAPCCDKAKVKRGPWSPEEDSTLKDYIQKHGTGGNWIALPHKAGLRRCGKSCRLRWLNYLRPDIKLGGFTEEEDNIILTLYITIGSRWSVIATHLPGRTDNDVKNHWNTKLKKKLAPQSATTSNTTTTTTTNCSVSTTNSMHFSSTTLPPLGPKAKGNGSPMTIMDNYQQILIAPEIIPSYPIIDSSTTTSFNSTVSSSQEYPILSPFSTGNDDHYPEWPGNGSGCGGGGFPFDILNIEDFDIRQAIMEGGYLASPNHSSLGFYHSTLMN